MVVTARPRVVERTLVLQAAAAAGEGEEDASRVHWSDDVVDNEGMGKKSSKSTFRGVLVLLLPHIPPLTPVVAPESPKACGRLRVQSAACTTSRASLVRAHPSRRTRMRRKSGAKGREEAERTSANDGSRRPKRPPQRRGKAEKRVRKGEADAVAETIVGVTGTMGVRDRPKQRARGRKVVLAQALRAASAQVENQR